MRKSSLLSTWLLPVFLLSLLIMSGLPPVSVEELRCLPSCLRCCRRLWALTRASFLQCTVQPVPLCFLGHCVAGSICEPPPSQSSREKVAQCLSLALYIPKLRDEGLSSFLPDVPSVATQSHLTLFSPPRHKSYHSGKRRSGAENSLQ